jgi:hypothetical protein
MSNRTAKCASAIFAGFLAGAPLTIISYGAAGADDECLSSPKEQTSQGGHWYYRIDHATKRHCWYLREEGEKLSKNAPPRSTLSARAVAPKTAAPMQSSVADAHAELPAQTSIEQPSRDRPVPAISADAAVGEMNRDTKPPVEKAEQSIVASRWLGQSDADPSTSATFLTSPTPMAGPMPDSSAPSNSMPSSSMPSSSVPGNSVPSSPSMPSSSLPNSPAPDSAAPNKVYPDTKVSAVPSTQALSPQPLSPQAASQFAAPDLSSGTPTHSVQMLLAAMMGALALAGVMGRAIFKFVGPRRPGKRRGRGRRGAIWKSAATNRRESRIYPGEDALPPRPDFPRDLDQVAEPDDRIADLLRGFSRKGRRVRNEHQPDVGLSP